MAETRFIKTTAFGGYDRSDVDKRLEYLYTKFYELKNEQREMKLMHEKTAEGMEIEKAVESVLAVEQAKITQLQVKAEAMSEKVKSANETARMREKENAELQERIKALEEELAETKLSLATLQASDSAQALGLVFVEAQKSRDMLITTAKTEAEKLEADAKLLVENMIIDADNQAAKIIYEAEKRAAEIVSFARTRSAEMEAASGNLRATLLSDIERFDKRVDMLREAFESFIENGMGVMDQAKEQLDYSRTALCEGGVPVFTMPETCETEYPEEPVMKPRKATPSEEAAAAAEAQKSELDKLQAMANAIDSKPKKSGINLADLANQAAQLAESKPEKAEKKEEKPKGSMNLADLMKQAAALES